MNDVSERDLKNILAAFDALDSGVAIYGPSFELRYVNDVSRRNFPEMYDALAAGDDMRAAIRKGIVGVNTEDAGGDVDQMTEFIAEKVTSCTALEMPTEDGRIVKAYHARMPDGGFVGLSADVTELRDRERELRHARREALAASEAKSEFLASMSHEIRTPLNGILGMAQVLSGRNLFGEEKEMIDAIVESSKSLMTVLNDVLDLSKIEAGKLDVTPVPDDLRHKVSRIGKFHRPIADEKGLYFRFVVDACVPHRLCFDPVRVRQCIDNLISNAIKFTDSGGVIVAVTSDPCPNEDGANIVKVHVSDTGMGIPPDVAEGLFQNFTQGDASTTRRFGGTGLGLSIARRLARMMDGDLTVVSKPGKGSVFTLTFMAQTAEPHRVSSTPAQSFERVDVSSANSSLRGRRALVVDDNAINRRVARLFLEPLGLIATEAANGEEALAALQNEPYDLVLLDIHMPVLDGPATLRRIRGSGAFWADIPVIALTADAMSGDREKYVSMGMDGYISKPIEERQFISAMTNALVGRTISGVPHADNETNSTVDGLFDSLSSTGTT